MRNQETTPIESRSIRSDTEKQVHQQRGSRLFAVGLNYDELPFAVLQVAITRRLSTARGNYDTDDEFNGMDAGLAVAHLSANAFTFGDGIDAVNGGSVVFSTVPLGQ